MYDDETLEKLRDAARSTREAEPARIEELLSQHRGGCDKAAEELRNAFMDVVWDKLLHRQKSLDDNADEYLSQLFADLATAVDRLRFNAKDLTAYISAELFYSDRHINDPLVVGKLKRINGVFEILDSLDDPVASLPQITPGGQPYRVPSKYLQLGPLEQLIADESIAEREATYHRLLPFARSDLERRVLIAFRDGTSDSVPGVSDIHLESTFSRLKLRAA